jgi:membrane protein
MLRPRILLRYLLVPFRAGHKWIGDRCTTYAAALAYYSAFSLAPILVIAVSVAGLIFGEQAASGRIVAELEALIGPEGAALVQRMIAASASSGEGWVATLVGTGAMLLGATGLFMQMGHGFEAVFGRPDHARAAWVRVLMARLKGLTVIVGVGFLLMVSLVASAAILAIGEYATRGMQALLWLASLLQLAITVGLQTMMIAILYKVLVPVRLTHRALIAGALVTALLFEVGKWVVGGYMGRSGISSTFGAAGSLAVILVWVYYVSLIMLYGAEVTYQLDRLDRIDGRVIRIPRKKRRQADVAQVRARQLEDARRDDPAAPALLKPDPLPEPAPAPR